MQQAIAEAEEYAEAELAYRDRVVSAEEMQEATFEFLKMRPADERADALLREHLAPQQLIEWLATDSGFLVRGGETGDTYRVRVGDGFERLDPVTLERQESYCLHPEEWIPHADVALATKLGLESPETEHDILDGAAGNDWKVLRRPFEEELVAAKIERELIP